MNRVERRDDGKRIEQRRAVAGALCGKPEGAISFTAVKERPGPGHLLGLQLSPVGFEGGDRLRCLDECEAAGEGMEEKWVRRAGFDAEETGRGRRDRAHSRVVVGTLDERQLDRSGQFHRPAEVGDAVFGGDWTAVQWWAVVPAGGGGEVEQPDAGFRLLPGSGEVARDELAVEIRPIHKAGMRSPEYFERCRIA